MNENEILRQMGLRSPTPTPTPQYPYPTQRGFNPTKRKQTNKKASESVPGIANFFIFFHALPAIFQPCWEDKTHGIFE